MSVAVHMEVERLLEPGNLTGARRVLVEAVRQADDPFLRWLLFEVHSLSGNWAAAQAQAEALKVLDPRRVGVFQLYGSLAASMTQRDAVWRGEQTPRCLDDSWLLWKERAPLLHALHGSPDAAIQGMKQLDRALDADTQGRCDGNPFTRCSDRDARLGFGFEAIVEGEYWWFQWSEIHRVQAVRKELHRRDMVWRPVMLTLRSAKVLQAFLPVRYPGTDERSEPLVVAGLETVFRPFNVGELGQGTRLLHCESVDHPQGIEVPLTTFRLLEFFGKGSP